MDAKTYLSFLKQSNDPRGRKQTLSKQTKEIYAKFRQAQFEKVIYDGQDNEKDDNLLNQADDFLNQFVLLPFINALSPNIQSELSDITLGVLYIESINANTLRSPSGEPLIVFNGGFLALVSHYMETIYTAGYLSNVYSDEFSYSYLMQQYNFIIEYFKGNQAHFPEPIVSISKQHFYSSLAQTVAIETFAVAHELAHIYAGHLDKSQKKNLNILPESNVCSDIYQLSWEHEYEADRIAWLWYQDVWDKIPIISELSLDSALTSPLHLFRLMSLIEKYAPIKKQLASHPPAIERLRRLIESLPSSLSTDAVNFAQEMPSTIENLPDYDVLQELATGAGSLGSIVLSLEFLFRGKRINDLGLMNWKSGQFDKALELFQQALIMARLSNDRNSEAAALDNLGLVYSDAGQQKKALEVYEQALEITQEIGDRSGEASTLNNMAGAYRRTDNLPQALDLYQQALVIRREINDLAGEGTTLTNIAGVYREFGQLEKAEKLYLQALQVRQKAGDITGKAITYNNLALLYRDFGLLAKALEAYVQVLKIKRELEDHDGVASVQQDIYEVCYSREEDKVFDLLQQTHSNMQEAGDFAGQAIILNMMARLSYSANQPEKALELFKQIMNIMQELDDKIGEATVKSDIGMMYREINKPEEALVLLVDSFQIMQEIGDIGGQARTLNGIAYSLIDLNQFDRAINTFEAAIILEKQAHHIPGEISSLIGAAILLYQYLNQKERALDYVHQSIKLMEENGLSTDTAGNTHDDLLRYLALMQANVDIW